VESGYRALVLFDIDGTLLAKAGPHHRRALEAAVSAATGLPSTTDGIPVAGMLDTDIVMAMLAAAGVRRQRALAMLASIRRDAAERYRRTCPGMHDKVCPGVRSLLRGLARKGAVAGLVTGNFERIAWRKMERCGLRSFFRFGAFAGQGRTRGALARRASNEARRRGWIREDTPVCLIGDHPNDIRAAREAGLVSVAVGTGVVSLEELAALEPDILVPDLRSLPIEQLLSLNGSPKLIGQAR
jgi:phosphoglycolate phosphatase-like HAD superfamily hydrolase